MSTVVEQKRPVERVIVVIVGFHGTADIVSCLSSLQASSYPEFEIHICENAGREAYEELIAALSAAFGALSEEVARSPKIAQSHSGRLGPSGQRIISNVCCAESNLGYAGAVNACIEAVEDETWGAVWVLNPDTNPEPDALIALFRHAAAGDFGMVGSCLAYSEGGSIHVLGGFGAPGWAGA